MVKKFLRDKVRTHLAEVLKTKTSPHSIALGFAYGTFIGIMPTPGFGILLGLVTVLVFKNVSKLSLFLALAIWNPLVLIPISTLGYRIGGLILGPVPDVEYRVRMVNQAYNFTARLLIGNLTIATILSVLSYFTVKKIAEEHHQ